MPRAKCSLGRRVANRLISESFKFVNSDRENSKYINQTCKPMYCTSCVARKQVSKKMNTRMECVQCRRVSKGDDLAKVNAETCLRDDSTLPNA
jgi:hypothetical protein